MHIFDRIKLKALKGVMHPDEAFLLRRIFRWYSKEFSTPLHQVEELYLEDVLLTYFESCYDGLKEEELQKEVSSFLRDLDRAQNPDEKDANEESDEEFLAELDKMYEKQKLESKKEVLAENEEEVIGFDEESFNGKDKGFQFPDLD